jgi:hypothetical protein
MSRGFVRYHFKKYFSEPAGQLGLLDKSHENREADTDLDSPGDRPDNYLVRRRIDNRGLLRAVY